MRLAPSVFMTCVIMPSVSAFKLNLSRIGTFQTSDLKIVMNRRRSNNDDDLDDLDDVDEENELEEEDDDDDEEESEIVEERVPTPKTSKDAEDDLDTDQETDRLLGQQYNDDNGYYDSKVSARQ